MPLTDAESDAAIRAYCTSLDRRGVPTNVLKPELHALIEATFDALEAGGEGAPAPEASTLTAALPEEAAKLDGDEAALIEACAGVYAARFPPPPDPAGASGEEP